MMAGSKKIRLAVLAALLLAVCGGGWLIYRYSFEDFSPRHQLTTERLVAGTLQTILLKHFHQKGQPAKSLADLSSDEARLLADEGADDLQLIQATPVPNYYHSGSTSKTEFEFLYQYIFRHKRKKMELYTAEP